LRLGGQLLSSFFLEQFLSIGQLSFERDETAIQIRNLLIQIFTLLGGGLERGFQLKKA
jgi:hypothetical protein